MSHEGNLPFREPVDHKRREFDSIHYGRIDGRAQPYGVKGVLDKIIINLQFNNFSCNISIDMNELYNTKKF